MSMPSLKPRSPTGATSQFRAVPSQSSNPARLPSRQARACDTCRRKKIRCDRPEMVAVNPSAICSPCVQAGLDCTSGLSSLPRSAPKWYLLGLEERVTKMQALLEKLHPGVRFPELDGVVEVGAWNLSDRPWRADAPPPLANKKEEEPNPVPKEASAMAGYIKSPYHGVSHPYDVVQATIQRRFSHLGSDPQALFAQLLGCSRPYYLVPPAWEVKLQAAWKGVRFNFPPHDLAMSLITLYFEYSNISLPLLHRPTFMSAYLSRQHEQDAEFGAIVIMVCAIGSRWSDDPRVRLLENPHSAGWCFFEQIQRLPRLYSHDHSLQALQSYALAALYLLGTSLFPISFSIIGFALRIAQGMGIHCKNSNDTRSEAEKELWKRLFWILVFADRTLSSSLGRPSGLNDEEITIEPPLEVDDDYWPQNPGDAFQQPTGVPSYITAFNLMLSVIDIRVEAHKRMDPDSWARRNGDADPTEEWLAALTEMNDALYLWFEQLPRHLHWDPSAPTPFFRQSVLLHGLYYASFLAGHRATLHLPSSIRTCVEASQAVIRLLEVATAREPDVGCPLNIFVLFSAAVCIQLGAWTDLPPDIYASPLDKHALQRDVQSSVRMLAGMEPRWVKAGKYVDLLNGALTMEARDKPAENNVLDGGLLVPHITVHPGSSGPPSLSYTPDLLPSGPGSASGSGSGSGSGHGVLPNPSKIPTPVTATVDPSLLAAPNTTNQTDAAALDDAALYSMLFSYQPEVNPLDPATFDVWNPPTSADEWDAWQKYLSTGEM